MHENVWGKVTLWVRSQIFCLLDSSDSQLAGEIHPGQQYNRFLRGWITVWVLMAWEKTWDAENTSHTWQDVPKAGRAFLFLSRIVSLTKDSMRSIYFSLNNMLLCVQSAYKIHFTLIILFYIFSMSSWFFFTSSFSASSLQYPSLSL